VRREEGGEEGRRRREEGGTKERLVLRGCQLNDADQLVSKENG
jgi:hypothetical protein